MRLGTKWVVGVLAAGGLLGGFIVGCGSEDEAKKTSSGTSYTFATDIEPIIKASCGGTATCHAAGESGTPIYGGAKAKFIADADKIIQRIDSTGADRMPELASGKTLSASDKQKLKDYLAQGTKN